jgi:DNA polymerase I-like protein with 3'-5' exonuclease and polymerase domains
VFQIGYVKTPSHSESERVFEIARDAESLRRAYKILRDSKIIGGDTETGGFVPQKVPLWSLQLSSNEYSVLVPFNALKTIGPLQDILLAEEIIKVFHNGKFDLKFLTYNGIEVVNVADTMVTEKLITAGNVTARHGLKDLALKYLGYQMSKEERSDFYDGTFYRDSRRNPMKAWTPVRIDYALDDVWVLPPIHQAQQLIVDEQDMGRVNEVESALVPVVARMELLGVAMDVSKTEAFGDRMQAKADVLRVELADTYERFWQQYWRPLYKQEMKEWKAWETPYKEAKRKASAKFWDSTRGKELKDYWATRIKEASGTKCPEWNEFCEDAAYFRKHRDNELATERMEYLAEWKKKTDELREQKPYQHPPKERKPISITSNQQLQAALAQAGVELPNMQKVTLEDMSGQDETLDLLLDFRKYEKLAKYRTVILEELNDVTDRVHPDINQIVSTGRFSISKPPLQQIPVKSDEGKELRSCFIAPYGRRIVSADYSAIELVLIGALSRDANLLEAIRKQEDPNFDLHAWTMSKFLQVPYEDLMEVKEGAEVESITSGRARFEAEVQVPELTSAPDLQTWFKRLRDVIKTLTYALAYGLSEFGLSRKFHTTPEAARAIIDLFYRAYPGVKKFIHDAGQAGLDSGFSVTPLGRRRNFYVPQMPTPEMATREILKELAEEPEEERREWKDIPRMERERLVSRKLWEMKKEREWILGAIRRQAANAPIQGASADMTKLAMVIFESKTQHWPYEDFLRLTVHDELLAEVGVELAEEAAQILEESMVEAAYEFLPQDIPVKAEAKISTHWDK